jgi:hypothetical protein
VSALLGGTRGRLLSAVAVVAGLAAVYGVGTVSHATTVGSSTQLRQPSQAAVVSAIRACPEPGSTGATAGGLATAAAPRATGPGSTGSGSTGSGSTGSGSAVITRLSGAGSATAGTAVRTLTKTNVLNLSAISTAPKPQAEKSQKPAKKPTQKHSKATPGGGSTASPSSGSGSGVPTTPGRGGVAIQATGAMAQGLEAEETDPSGLVTGQCPAPGTDFWFVGPGVTSAAQISLYLMNPGDQAADVQVDALTDSGPLLGSSDTGIVVPPHGVVVQSLGQLLHISRVIALHVSTSIGQVAAAVRETKNSSDAGGWLPATQAPSKSVIIPGVPGLVGARDLYIVVPGTRNAQIKVTAVTAKGSYQPTGGNGIDLAGDSVVAIPLPSLSGVAAAIRISADVPVTAAIMVPGGAAGAPGAISAAAAPISEQGIAAASPAGSSGSSSLVISAPAAGASVRIVSATSKIAFTDQGATVVNVAAGHTIVTKIKPPHGGKNADFAVEVTPLPGSGPVYVGRVISSGGVVRSILPVTSTLTWVPLPPTQDSLTVGHSGR